MFRNGADIMDDMTPEERKGYLDYVKLTAQGLDVTRISEEDSLFFLQLLLPLVDPTESGIENDLRHPFFHAVQAFTNSYAFKAGRGGMYGHNFKPVTEPELVRFFGIVLRDGLLGGSRGDIHRRWREGPAQDEDICRAMTYARFLQIKRVLKLCCNDISSQAWI